MNTIKTRRDFLKTVSFGAAALALGGQTFADKSTDKPNILYIMSDDHTSQAIGCYDGRLAGITPTKNIDAIARQGMVMENVFCTNSICTPSRATIITGQYSQENGALAFHFGIDADKQYLPNLMKKAGYQTAMVGKWHIESEPAFEYYQVLPGQGDYFNPTFYEKGKGSWEKNSVKYKGHCSDVVTDISLDWLQNKRDKNKPFFLMHHFKAPHGRWQNAKRFDNLLEDVEIPEPANLRIKPVHRSVATEGLGTRISDRMGKMMKIDRKLPPEEYTTQSYQKYLKQYLRCVAGIDENVGRLMNYLNKENLLENTIVIYTSDQGMFLGEHDYIDKRWIYEESMRMPFIVRYPKMIAPGTRCDALINNTDFAPTLLDIAGQKTPDFMHGSSFLPFLQGRAVSDWRKATYYRYWLHLVHHSVPAHFGIRTQEYKLIFFYGLDYETEGKTQKPTQPGWELYDMKNDPKEMKNLYGDPKYASVTKELKAEMLRLRKKFNETDEKYPHIQKVIDQYWDK